jgi:hypothetical protein
VSDRTKTVLGIVVSVYVLASVGWHIARATGDDTPKSQIVPPTLTTDMLGNPRPTVPASMTEPDPAEGYCATAELDDPACYDDDGTRYDDDGNVVP